MRSLLSFLFFLALAAAYTRPLCLDLGGSLPVGPDPLIDLWTVNWISAHLFSGEIFQGNIFHPFQGSVLHSDLSLGTAVLVAPLRLLVRDPVPLYNLALLLALAFSGWAFAELGRVVSGHTGAGLLAGVLAAFGSHQVYHLYHLNLLSTGFIALFVLGLLRVFDRPGAWAALVCGASFSLAAQSSGYYAVACTVVALVMAGLRWRDLRQRRVFAHAALAAGLALALTAPYLYAFAQVRAEQGQALERDPELSVRMAFQPGRDLTSQGYLYRPFLGGDGERLFPGLLTLGLVGVALARRRPHAGTLAIVALVLTLLSLGPRLRLFGLDVALPYGALFAIPPLDSMRHPYTFAAVATFLLTVVAAAGFAALDLSRSRRATATALGLALLETIGPGLVVRAVPRALPLVYAHLLTLPAGAAVDLPVLDAESLLHAARHGRPVVNGSGAFSPLYTATLDRHVRRHWLGRVPEDVDASKPAEFLKRAFDARYLIVPVGRDPRLKSLAAAFDRSRGFRLLAEVADGDKIYEILPRAAVLQSNPGVIVP
jgi:hypothetical protein